MDTDMDYIDPIRSDNNPIRLSMNYNLVFLGFILIFYYVYMSNFSFICTNNTLKTNLYIYKISKIDIKSRQIQ